MRWEKHVAGIREREIKSVQKISVRKPERKKEGTKWSRLR
jgi:hypothetical protein